jgi:hypothetical protein
VQLTTYQKGGVIASAVWATVVIVYASSGPRFSDQVALRYGVVPLLIGWMAYFLVNSKLFSKSITVEAGALESNLEKIRAQAGPRPASPGWRYAARSLDFLIAGFFYWCLLEFVVRRGSLEFDDALLYHPRTTVFIFSLFYPPFALLCEAGCYLLFRTTPGKSLASLTVEDRNGVQLDPPAYARRNLRLWAKALACGVPGLSFIFLLVSARRLSTTGYAPHDALWGDKVMQKSPSIGRKFGFCSLYAVLFSVVQLGFVQPFAKQVGEAAGINLVLHKFGGEGWINPITKKIAVMQGWKLKEHSARHEWVLDSVDGSRVIIFYAGDRHYGSLADIASRLRLVGNGLWRLTGAGENIPTVEGDYAWEGRRTLDGTEGNGSVPSVLITRIEYNVSGLWYILYVSPLPSGGGFYGGDAAIGAVLSST